MYRYSRGQSGQSSLPRPAWGSSGSHGARAASPEPGGLSTGGSAGGAPPGGGGSSGAAGDAPRERHEEVILQLENELIELRNACAWKDQRIAELSRTDTPAARLKRDIRHLASELRYTRKQLGESIGEVQAGAAATTAASVVVGRDSAISDAALPTNAGVGATTSGAGAQQVASGSAGASRERNGSSGGCSSTGADRGTQLRERISELTDENRQLRETVMQLKAQTSRQNGTTTPTEVTTPGVCYLTASACDPLAGFDGTHSASQQSGASTQRSSVPPQPSPTAVAAVPQGRTLEPPPPPAGGYAGATTLRASYLAGGSGAQSGGGQEEPLRQIVYSSAHLENAATIGPTMLQGVGAVDGVASIAKVLLQRIHSSVCSAHRRPGGPGPHGQMVTMAPSL